MDELPSDEPATDPDAEDENSGDPDTARPSEAQHEAGLDDDDEPVEYSDTEARVDDVDLDDEDEDEDEDLPELGDDTAGTKGPALGDANSGQEDEDLPGLGDDTPATTGPTLGDAGSGQEDEDLPGLGDDTPAHDRPDAGRRGARARRMRIRPGSDRPEAVVLAPLGGTVIVSRRQLAYTAEIRAYGSGSKHLSPSQVLVHEHRVGGYRICLELRPRVADAEQALHAVIGNRIHPGRAAWVTLRFADGEDVLRSWPGVVTAVSSREPRHGEDTPRVMVTLVDPLSAVRDEPLWLGIAGVDLAALVGAAFSSVAAGDGVPSVNPIVPSMPSVAFRSHVRDAIRTVPYAVGAGETFWTWLEQLQALLKVRLELVGLADGSLVATITDKEPKLGGLNEHGPIELELDLTVPVSARNVHVRHPTARVWPSARGGVLDVVRDGVPRRFGPEGPVERVLHGTRVSRSEGFLRQTMDHCTGAAGQVQIEIEAAQPGLIPGRVVTFENPPRYRDGTPVTPLLIFGAPRWQVVEVSHIFVGGAYTCTAVAEKSGAPWHPTESTVARQMRVVSGIIDDTRSSPGTPVLRNRMGFLPVRLAFAGHLQAAADSFWSPSLQLVSCLPAGGGQHGFVNDARQGDMCRVTVHNLFFAEISGYVYRDDRPLNDSARDASVGVLLHQDADEWRGLGFLSRNE